MADRRKTVLSLLAKLGVANGKELSAERAEKKLGRRLETGIPQDLTADETALVKELGFTIPEGAAPEADPDVKADNDEAAEEVAAQEQAAPKASKKAPAKASTPAAPKKGGTGSSKKGEPEAPPKKAAGRDRASGGMAAFRDAFKTRKTADREELIKDVVEKGGCQHWSVRNYISAAKREDSPFGFRLEEKAGKDGKKILTKVG